MTIFPPTHMSGEPDIVPLARHFLGLLAREAGRPEPRLQPEDERALVAYAWPGNIRELQHVMARAMILSPGPSLRLDVALPAGVRPGSAPLREEDIRAMERKNLILALEKCHWRVAGEGGAAEVLGVHPSTLRDRMKALGVSKPS